MMAVWIDEFLFRGRKPGGAIAPAWHLKLAAENTDAFGKVVVQESSVMNMAAAKEAGWSLPKVLAEINVELAVEVEALRAEKDKLVSEVESLRVAAEK